MKMRLILGCLLMVGFSACQSPVESPLVQDLGSDPLNYASLDLNGDGKLDEIRFEMMGAPESFDGTYALFVNDAMIEGSGWNLDPGFRVVDMDDMDAYLELAVSDFGPSDDHETDFYYYDGRELHSMGTTSGLVSQMHFDAEGFFTTLTRGQVLDTWFYDDWYRLTQDHRLEEQPQDLYARETSVTMLKEFTFQKSQTDTSEAFTLKVGDRATITGCDNVEWCVLKNAAGEEGWFAVEEFNQIRGTDFYSGDLFEGLSFAD